MRVRRRNGTVAEFDVSRVSVAITKAFLAAEGPTAGQTARARTLVTELTDAVVAPLAHRYGDRQRAAYQPIPLEQVQDQVELELMRGGHVAVARAYILYREEHRKAREATRPAHAPTMAPTMVPTVPQLPQSHCCTACMTALGFRSTWALFAHR